MIRAQSKPLADASQLPEDAVKPATSPRRSPRETALVSGAPSRTTGPCKEPNKPPAACNRGESNRPRRSTPTVLKGQQEKFQTLAAACIDLLLSGWPDNATSEDKEGFQRLLTAQVHQRLPPLPKPPGRPLSSQVTEAEKLHRIDLRKLRLGQIKRIKWRLIATQVIPNFEYLSTAEMNESVARVRNSVKARLRSQAKKRKTLGLSSTKDSRSKRAVRRQADSERVGAESSEKPAAGSSQ